jgi:hemerythrin
MVFWEWQNDCLINIDRFDTHHKKLALLVNTLYVDVFECADISQRQGLVGKALVELVDYTYYHLMAEEETLLMYEYPGYLHHKEEHDQFRLQINQLMEQYKEGTLVWSFSIFVVLKDWITLHILNTDREYASFLKERKVK